MTATTTSTLERPRGQSRRLARLAALTIALAAPAVMAASSGASAAVPTTNVFPIAHPNATCANNYGAPRDGHSHAGVDCGFTVPIGTPLVAVEAGRIENKTDSPSGCQRGNALRLVGASGTTYYYGHLDRITVSSGNVSRGQVIGTMGQTGNANPACGGGGAHLHFEMRLNGTTVVDPYPYVSRWPKVGAGTTPPPTTGDARQPIGRFDHLDARGDGRIGFWGWTADPDTPARAIPVHVYVTRANGVRTYHPYLASQLRTDVGAAYPGYGSYHGYSAVIGGLPRGWTKVDVYGIDSSGKANDYVLLGTRWINVT